jgi:oligoendopeptidase F
VDWDLTPYFPAFDGPEHRGFRDALERDAEALGAEIAALPGVEAAREGWVALLRRLEDVAARSAHLGSYLHCLASADARDEAVQRETARLAGLRAELAKRYARVRAALAEAPDPAFEALVADPGLAHAGYFLRRLREEAARRMPPALEELAADLEVTGLAAWARLYGRVSGSLEFDLEVPGEAPRRVPVSLARSLQGDARPELRRAALRGSNAAWSAQADVLAACLNAIAGTRLALYRRRGIDDFLEPALFEAGITRRTLDAMLGAVLARRDVARRYLRR